VLRIQYRTWTVSTLVILTIAQPVTGKMVNKPSVPRCVRY